MDSEQKTKFDEYYYKIPGIGKNPDGTYVQPKNVVFHPATNETPGIIHAPEVEGFDWGTYKSNNYDKNMDWHSFVRGYHKLQEVYGLASSGVPDYPSEFFIVDNNTHTSKFNPVAIATLKWVADRIRKNKPWYSKKVLGGK